MQKFYSLKVIENALAIIFEDAVFEFCLFTNFSLQFSEHVALC